MQCAKTNHVKEDGTGETFILKLFQKFQLILLGLLFGRSMVAGGGGGWGVKNTPNRYGTSNRPCGKSLGVIIS